MTLHDENGRVLPHPIRYVVEQDLAVLDPTVGVERLRLDAEHPVGMDAFGAEEMQQCQRVEETRGAQGIKERPQPRECGRERAQARRIGLLRTAHPPPHLAVTYGLDDG